ncbi:MAG TPA: phosphohistidine phosphatase SixA [Terriglobia bacterium]|nr:phosphohistidine phosphatase SixA [Terriglobia bacterium]
MRLYLVRHGIAEPPGDANNYQDFHRSLTPEGAKKMREVSSGMKGLEIDIDRVASSPLIRAKETAGIIAEVLGTKDPVEYWDELIPGAPAQQTVARLQGCKNLESVALVGHQPHLGYLAALLIFGQDSISLDLKKGGICCIEVEQFPIRPPHPLVWLLPPKILRLFSST